MRGEREEGEWRHLKRRENSRGGEREGRKEAVREEKTK